MIYMYAQIFIKEDNLSQFSVIICFLIIIYYWVIRTAAYIGDYFNKVEKVYHIKISVNIGKDFSLAYFREFLISV